MNGYLKKLIRNKDHYFKKYTTTNLNSDHDIYKYHRNKLVNEMRIAESKYYDKLSEDLQINQTHSKKWWSLLKRALKNKTSALHETPIMDNNFLMYDDTCKAEVFNKFFTESVQTENPDDPVPSDHNLLYYPKIPDFEIDIQS